MKINNSYNDIDVPDYCIYISATLLIVFLIVGGFCHIILMATLLSSKALRKAKYTFLVNLCVANILFSLLWIPIELAQLFHQLLYNFVSARLTCVSHSLNIFLFILVASTVLVIMIKCWLVINIPRFCDYEHRFVRISLAVCWMLGVLAGIIILITILTDDTNNDRQSYHLILGWNAYYARFSIITIYIGLTIVVLTVAVSTAFTKRAKNQATSKSATDVSSPKENSESSPCIQKQPDKQNGETDKEPEPNNTLFEQTAISRSPIKISPLLDTGLSTPQENKRRNSLTINFGNVLNRRRHTICEVSEAAPPVLPAKPTNQYNYVRKFSVDLMALQAQLANPKTLGSEQVFLSQQDINSAKDPVSPNDLLRSKTSLTSIREDEATTVTQDETRLENHDNTPDHPVINIEETKRNSVARYYHLYFNYMKFSALMVATFLLSIVPLYVTEISRSHISVANYAKAITLTLAISTVQIALYPVYIYHIDMQVKKSSRAFVRTVWLRLTGRYKSESDENDNGML